MHTKVSYILEKLRASYDIVYHTGPIMGKTCVISFRIIKYKSHRTQHNAARRTRSTTLTSSSTLSNPHLGLVTDKTAAQGNRSEVQAYLNCVSQKEDRIWAHFSER